MEGDKKFSHWWQNSVAIGDWKLVTKNKWLKVGDWNYGN
jgi:hypothetical protein